MNQNYICCKCNQPVKQPCCQFQSPKSAHPPEDCPFGYSAEWERAEFIDIGIKKEMVEAMAKSFGLIPTLSDTDEVLPEAIFNNYTRQGTKRA